MTKKLKKTQDKFEIKVIDKNIMKVLGPLINNHDFDGDLDLDE